MGYSNILPALYTTLTHIGDNYDWVGVKMNINTQTSTEYEYDPDRVYFFTEFLPEEGGQEVDGGMVWTNTLNIKIQTLVFIDSDRTIPDDDDYEDIVVRGKVHEDILKVMNCYSELGNHIIQQPMYLNDDFPEDQVPKGNDVIRTDYYFSLTYEERI